MSENQTKIEKLKCKLCGSEVSILVQITVAGEGYFGRINRGICCQCFRNGDIEQAIFLWDKKFCKEQIKSAEERVQLWKKQLNEININSNKKI